MKKLAVLLAVVSIAALAAPAFSATNPFMDVPMNHWAYDAIGQLAAHGILSGYPDGLYKGKQPTTRYEMASALARALAVVDMTKASKQDVEMLKRLVVEFKDELEALGVRVDELDERVAVLEDRLGGWHIHGDLALDLTYKKNNDNPDPDASFNFDDAKLYVERRWGEDDEYFFMARFASESGQDSSNRTVEMTRFFAEMPFFFDSRLTVGRFGWNWESAYKISSNLGNAATGSWFGDAPMTDWTWDGFGLTKNFAIGTFKGVLSHVSDSMAGGVVQGDDRLLNGGVRNAYPGETNPWNAWMLMLGFNMQFTEQFGLDLGGQVFVGDNAELVPANPANGDTAFDKMWTVWAGLNFNFNENIGLKGIFYHQDFETKMADTVNNRWNSVGYNRASANGGVVDDANHWALMVDVKQEALKYTSLWLEYGQYDQDYITRSDASIFFSPSIGYRYAPGDTKYWRVGLGQEWNDKWATHLFYYGYKVEDFDRLAGNVAAGREWKPSEFGLGVQYHLNDYTNIGLNYVHVKDAMPNQAGNGYDDDDVIRMRTTVSF
ncbi:MAG: S-layer homology domain-containing protein [Synergistaceae bacterium]|nr:S-layer homology domain-containing protein [Synergistaceae bacterium]